MFFIFLIFSYNCSIQDCEDNSDKNNDTTKGVHLSKLKIFENSDNLNKDQKHWKKYLKEKYLKEISRKSHIIIHNDIKKPTLKNSYVRGAQIVLMKNLSNQLLMKNRIKDFKYSSNKFKEQLNNGLDVSPIEKSVLGSNFEDSRIKTENKKDSDKLMNKKEIFIRYGKGVNLSFKDRNNISTNNVDDIDTSKKHYESSRVENFEDIKAFYRSKLALSRHNLYLGDDIFDMYHLDLKISSISRNALKIKDDYLKKNNLKSENSQVGYSELYSLLKLTLLNLKSFYLVKSKILIKKMPTDSFDRSKPCGNTYEEKVVGNKSNVKRIEKLNLNLETEELLKAYDSDNKQEYTMKISFFDIFQKDIDFLEQKKPIKNHAESLDITNFNVENNLRMAIPTKTKIQGNIELMKFFFEFNIDDKFNYSIGPIKLEFHVLCILFPEYIILFYKMKKVFQIAMDNKIDLEFPHSKFEKNSFLLYYYLVVRDVKNCMNFHLNMEDNMTNIDKELILDDILSFIPEKSTENIKKIKYSFINISDMFFRQKTIENYSYALEKDLEKIMSAKFCKSLYNLSFYSVLFTKRDLESFNLLDKQKKHIYKYLNRKNQNQHKYIEKKSSSGSILNIKKLKTPNVCISRIFNSKKSTEALILRSKNIGKIIHSIFGINYKKFDIFENNNYKHFTRNGKGIIYDKIINFYDIKKIHSFSYEKNKWQDAKDKILENYKELNTNNNEFLLLKPGEYLDLMYKNIICSIVSRVSNPDV